jgi:Right handed beta helix region
MLTRRALVVVLSALFSLLLTTSAAARVLIVTKRHVFYPHFTSIQRAVNAARPGDWILIGRGVYSGPVRITKPGLHLRGINRNGVIIDGRNRVGNGIEVHKTNGVWIENLTVRNFDRSSRDDFSTGNEIWWNGGRLGSRIGLRGWWGQYLTAYDTGLLGGYGIYAGEAVNGWMKHVYASGFNDAGIYIGACRDCRALVSDATSENNGLGYSGSNSGGHLIIERSTFRNNSVGLAPNSDSTGDPPPPQDGACNSAANRSNTPTFASTHISRCTIIRNNLIANNGNIRAPADSDVQESPWGVGIELPGTYADLITNNTIRGNPNFGFLGLEFPDPFPPTTGTIYFQLSGNRISDNRFSGNGTNPGGADIGMAGGAFGSQNSVNNCLSQNTFVTSVPAGVQGTWGCQNSTTPNPGAGLLAVILNLSGVPRNSVPQPAPHRQPTMPNPCRGVPRNPLCR